MRIFCAIWSTPLNAPVTRHIRRQHSIYVDGCRLTVNVRILLYVTVTFCHELVVIQWNYIELCNVIVLCVDAVDSECFNEMNVVFFAVIFNLILILKIYETGNQAFLDVWSRLSYVIWNNTHLLKAGLSRLLRNISMETFVWQVILETDLILKYNFYIICLNWFYFIILLEFMRSYFHIWW